MATLTTEKGELKTRLDSSIDENKSGNYGAALGLEVGVGLATDWATAPLLAAPVPGARPLYYGINYAVGAGTNILAQKIRGEDETNWGEVTAAGGFQTIPFGTTAKGWKGVRRAMGKGAAIGVGGEQVRVGIDEQRLLTPEEIAVSGTIGAGFGGTIKLGTESADILIKQAKDNRLKRANKFWRQPGFDPESPNPIPNPWEDGKTFNRVDTTNRRAREETEIRLGVLNKLRMQIDGTPLGRFRGTDYYETTLDPVYQRNLLSSDRTRYEGKAAVVPAPGESILTLSKFHSEAKAMKADLLDSLTPQWDYPIKFDIHQKGRTYAYRSHHEIPLLPSAKLKEGLNDAAKIELDTYMLEQGNPQGNQLSNLTIIPHDFHQPILHKTIIDLQLGGHGDLSNLVEKHYPGRNLYDLELWERKVITDDLIEVINQAREATYDFYRALAAFKDSSTPLSRLDVNTIIEAAAKSDRFGLDELLEQMLGGPNKRTALVRGFKTKFQKDFENAVIDEVIADMSGIQRISPLPRLINDIAIDTTGMKVALDRLGIMFRADGTVAQKKPLSAAKVNSKYNKKYNKDQLELFDDIEVTPELIQNLKLREELMRRSGSAGRIGPADTPSDKGQD